MDTNKALETLRSLGGFFEAAEYGLIEIYGKDAGRFLQAQTTNDVAALAERSSHLSCLLDRKAKIQACFELYRRHDSFRVIVEKDQVETILKHLDSFRIADKVEFLDLTQNGKFLALQGPRCRKVLRAGMKSQSSPSAFSRDLVDLELWGADCHIFRKSTTGEDGYFIWVTNANVDHVWKNLSAVATEFGLAKLDHESLEIARVEAGILKFGVDFGKENFLPETGLDQNTVSYTKGCFLGQEVLARVKHQGAPTRGLVGLVFPSTQSQALKRGDAILTNGEEIASVTSSAYSPSLNAVLAIISTKRDYRVPDKILHATISGAAVEPKVVLLPFYQPQPLKLTAKALYEKALTLYAREDDGNAQSQAVDLLREVIELDPLFEDGYEALGVILSKRGHLDEAIELMKMLVDLNADSVMAHTNLSVFYVEKGWKEKAEDEKGISVSIRMRQAMSQATNKKDELDQKAKELAETKDRMQMFSQVLEIDADDLLANYGMGSCHVVLSEFQRAIPYLQKAIEVKPNHTVAYTSLAQAFEGIGDNGRAIETYEKGIEVAAKRGDMMPLAEMQRRLAAVKQGASPVG